MRAGGWVGDPPFPSSFSFPEIQKGGEIMTRRSFTGPFHRANENDNMDYNFRARADFIFHPFPKTETPGQEHVKKLIFFI